MGHVLESPGIIVQARMGSSRLPGKVLMQMEGRTLLGHIAYRLGFMDIKVPIVIATSNLTIDDAIVDFCSLNGLSYFRGSEADVLARYYECAALHEFKHIVRLTGDNPFTDVQELEALLYAHVESGANYSSSCEVLPVGVGAEVFSFESLQESHLKGLLPHHREHVNEYILENQRQFRIHRHCVPKSKMHPEVRLTVDTEADMLKARHILRNAKTDPVTTQEAIALCMQFA